MAKRKKQETENTQGGFYTVAKQFKDRAKYAKDGEPRIYEVGEDVSHFDQDRLADLVGRGLVETKEGEVSQDSKSDNAE